MDCSPNLRCLMKQPLTPQTTPLLKLPLASSANARGLSGGVTLPSLGCGVLYLPGLPWLALWWKRAPFQELMVPPQGGVKLFPHGIEVLARDGLLELPGIPPMGPLSQLVPLASGHSCLLLARSGEQLPVPKHPLAHHLRGVGCMGVETEVPTGTVLLYLRKRTGGNQQRVNTPALSFWRGGARSSFPQLEPSTNIEPWTNIQLAHLHIKVPTQKDGDTTSRLSKLQNLVDGGS